MDDHSSLPLPSHSLVISHRLAQSQEDRAQMDVCVYTDISSIFNGHFTSIPNDGGKDSF